jgi:hypothetical protein
MNPEEKLPRPFALRPFPLILRYRRNERSTTPRSPRTRAPGSVRVRGWVGGLKALRYVSLRWLTADRSQTSGSGGPA